MKLLRLSFWIQGRDGLRRACIMVQGLRSTALGIGSWSFGIRA